VPAAGSSTSPGICQAEPALAEELAERFLRSYLSVCGGHVEDEQRLWLCKTLRDDHALALDAA
jgi:hypothetical protein